MSPEVQVALIAAGGSVAVATLGLLGVYIQLGRNRRGNQKDNKAVLTEVTALHESQDQVQSAVREIRDEQRKQGERLAKVEGQFEGHLFEQLRRR